MVTLEKLIAEVRRLLAAATFGPWVHKSEGDLHDLELIYSDAMEADWPTDDEHPYGDIVDVHRPADAALLVRAPELVAILCDTLDPQPLDEEDEYNATVNCALWSLCGNDATGEWVTTADVTTDYGDQADAELMLCDHHADVLGLIPRKEVTQ